MRFSVTRCANSHELVVTSVLFLAFSGSVYFGYHLFTAPAVISPAAGIALAGLILFGIRLWPIVFIGTYVTYLFLGTSFLFVVCFSLGHTLQAVAGAYLLQYFEFDRALARLRDILAFTVTTFLAATIAPTFGFVGLILIGAWEGGGMAGGYTTFTWNHWWTGMALSLLTLTPFIIRWYRIPSRRSLSELAETILSFAIMLIPAILLSFTDINRIGSISLVYVLLFPLGWIALRVGPRMMTLAIFLLTTIVITGTILRTEPERVGIELFQTEVFLIIIALIFLILVTVEEERKFITRRLRENVGDLEHALDRLNDQDEAKNNFIAVLAHELRNPLATITSNVELLRLGGHVSESGTESLNVIEKRLENVGRLLDDLLDVSRISENKITLKKQKLDLKEAINGAIENVDHNLRNKHQTLTTDLPPGPVTIKADPTRIEQVFTNLLHNASKFTDRDGRIDLSVKKKDHSAIITIRDSGIGIDPKHLAHIFDVFYQGKGQTAEARSGLGIGLALTNDFVHMHCGTITAKSPGKNQGSEFTVTLPLVRNELPEITVEDTRLAPDPESGLTWEKHVLVVDDNRAAAEGIAKLLELSGYTVTCAFTGTEALQQFTTSFKPDAVFLDISLPDISGFDIARKLRDEYQFTGTLAALSGYGQEEDKQQSYAVGCTHHLTKPVRLAELLEVLQ